MTESLLLKIALFWYAFMSLLLFIIYGLDKAQAVANGRRIPEKVLHFLAMAGGFPGGFLGRSYFHHKTRKPAFLIILVGSAVIHTTTWFLILK
ncbi:MAG TPA: DUF1294 domain-containing protein [Leptolinea sp.]